MRISVALAGVLAFFSLSAQAVVIDFEGAALGADPVTIGDFEIASVGGFGNPGVIDQGGDQAFQALYDDFCPGFSCSAEVSIKRSDNAAFSFHDIDIDWFAVGGGSFSVIGEVFGGGTVQYVTYGTGDWLNVTEVSIRASSLCTTNCGFPTNAGVTVDDIMVGAAVPIPAAVWLFGSALAGLGWMRRKQTV
jgi:hypothetical protein